MRPTIAIRIHGPQGSGKSTLARALLKYIATQGYDTTLPEEGLAAAGAEFRGNAVIETSNLVPPEL